MFGVLSVYSRYRKHPSLAPAPHPRAERLRAKAKNTRDLTKTLRPDSTPKRKQAPDPDRHGEGIGMGRSGGRTDVSSSIVAAFSLLWGHGGAQKARGQARDPNKLLMSRLVSSQEVVSQRPAGDPLAPLGAAPRPRRDLLKSLTQRQLCHVAALHALRALRAAFGFERPQLACMHSKAGQPPAPDPGRPAAGSSCMHPR